MTLDTPEQVAERLCARNTFPLPDVADAIRADREAIAARVRLIIVEYAEGQRNDLGSMLDELYAALRGAR